MKEGKVPYRRMIYVCTNTREGKAACGNADRGESCGAKILDALKEEVKASGLKREVRVARSGCMDLCGTGPNIIVFDERGGQTFLSRVSNEDVPELVQRYLRSLLHTT
jgi:(2Fe-2S) ferredoxin